MKKSLIKHIVFDHDGTLVDTGTYPRVFEGIEKLLSRLRDKGFKLYVWTARTRFSTVEILKSLDIITRFELLTCSTDPQPKPSALGLKEMLENAAGEEVVIIGDGPTDILGAKAYGAYAIGALWSFKGQAKEEAKKALNEFGADALAESPEECGDIILAI